MYWRYVVAFSLTWPLYPSWCALIYFRSPFQVTQCSVLVSAGSNIVGIEANGLVIGPQGLLVPLQTIKCITLLRLQRYKKFFDGFADFFRYIPEGTITTSPAC